MTDRETKIRNRAHSLWESKGSPDGRHDEHWSQAQREIDNGEGEIGSDDQPNLAVMREGARLGRDEFVVASDMEDADQREAAPGTREQP